MELRLISIIFFVFLDTVFEWILVNIQQTNHKKKHCVVKSGDKQSFRVISISILTGYLLSFSVTTAGFGQITCPDQFYIAGIVLIITGLFIRISAIVTLGRQFTFSVSVVRNHRIIRTGVYRIIRHPGYLGQLVIFFGISVALSNWLAIIFLNVPAFSGYLFRINVEEKFLKEQIGKEYIDYMQKTKRLIPFVY